MHRVEVGSLSLPIRDQKQMSHVMLQAIKNPRSQDLSLTYRELCRGDTYIGSWTTDDQRSACFLLPEAINFSITPTCKECRLNANSIFASFLPRKMHRDEVVFIVFGLGNTINRSCL